MARTSARPNILWICTDSQRPDTIGALGNPYIRTPTLDRLAEGGVAFTRAYAQSPMCTPSRSSFLTGTYPSAVHACRNGVPQFSDRFPLVTRLLADVGYDCALVGKLHLASAYGQVEPRVDDGYRTGATATRRATTGRRATTTPTGPRARHHPGRVDQGPERRAGRAAPDDVVRQ